ncbi:MAG: HAD family hydrolase [Arcobacteraceae bacterium]
MKNKQLIIFDMDGTLIDSGDVISNTINHVRTNVGLPKMPKELLLTSINNPDINPSEFFYGTKNFTKKHSKLFEEYYDKNCLTDIVLYDGIKDLLQNISEYFTLSIATNASVEYAQKMTKHLGIDHYIDYFIGADKVSQSKPHPEMLIKTTQSLNIQIKDAILIGDSNKDKNAAVACEMDYLLVNWGFTQHDHIDVILEASQLEEKLLSFK